MAYNGFNATKLIKITINNADANLLSHYRFFKCMTANINVDMHRNAILVDNYNNPYTAL